MVMLGTDLNFICMAYLKGVELYRCDVIYFASRYLECLNTGICQNIQI